MNKRILSACLCALLVFQGVSECRQMASAYRTGGRRGLFVSLVQEPPVLSNRQEIAKLMDFSKKAGIRILFVQVYRANKIYFSPEPADPSDAFAFLIREAHASGIEVHAWLNLLSLSQNEDAEILKKFGTGILTTNLREKKTLRDYRIDDQYFLEPGDPRVREELSGIVEKLLRSYPGLDGVQFDYIRYPDKDPFYGYTAVNMERFKKEHARKTIEEADPLWKKWRRDQVTGLLRLLVEKTRALLPRIQISTTGCMPYSRAYEEAFQDWPSWLGQGLVDFVTVMSYSTDTFEFKRYLAEAKKKSGNFRKLNIGIGAYKLTAASETFARQLRLCERSGCGACVVFHYGSLLKNRELAKVLNAKYSIKLN